MLSKIPTPFAMNRVFFMAIAKRGQRYNGNSVA